MVLFFPPRATGQLASRHEGMIPVSQSEIFISMRSMKIWQRTVLALLILGTLLGLGGWWAAKSWVQHKLDRHQIVAMIEAQHNCRAQIGSMEAEASFLNPQGSLWPGRAGRTGDSGIRIACSLSPHVAGGKAMSKTSRLHPNVALPNPEGIKRPPLTQRVAQFWFVIDQSAFDDGLPGWLQARLDDGSFEERQVREHWDFRVDMGPDKVPRPKATLTQIPKLIHHKDGGLTLEIAPPTAGYGASFKVIQPRTDEHPTRFTDFQIECDKFLGSLLLHLGVTEVGRLSLAYRNELTRERYPDQWNSSHSIRLGNLVHAYGAMPNPKDANFDGFLLDYTRVLSGGSNRRLKCHLGPETLPKKPAVWTTNFVFSSTLEAPGNDLAAASTELVVAHDHIFEEFSAQFTPVALDLFTK
jgi:hypothetical protein